MHCRVSPNSPFSLSSLSSLPLLSLLPFFPPLALSQEYDKRMQELEQLRQEKKVSFHEEDDKALLGCWLSLSFFDPYPQLSFSSPPHPHRPTLTAHSCPTPAVPPLPPHLHRPTLATPPPPPHPHCPTLSAPRHPTFAAPPSPPHLHRPNRSMS